MRILLLPRRRTASLAAFGGLALAIGVLVYLADRVPGSAMLLPAWHGPGAGTVFGAVGQWLPSFVHPLAFSLLTAAALAPAAKPRYGVCAGWCATDAAFELGQLPQLAGWLDAALHDSPLPAALTRPLADYVLRGRFDSADLAAVALGSLAAAGVLRLVHDDPKGRLAH